MNCDWLGVDPLPEDLTKGEEKMRTWDLWGLYRTTSDHTATKHVCRGDFDDTKYSGLVETGVTQPRSESTTAA